MLLLKLIPVIFRQIINRQKIYALPLIETKIRDFFYVFLIFSNFVYVVVSGTILMQLEVILQNPSTLIEQVRRWKEAIVGSRLQIGPISFYARAHVRACLCTYME